MEKKQLRETAKSLRMFVNYENINTRKLQLEKWQSRIEFQKDTIDKYKILNRIEKETDILNQDEFILEMEANRFLDKYYPKLNKSELTKDQKIEVVDITVSQNKLLSTNDIETVYRELEKKQIENDLNILLNNRPKFVLALQQVIQNAGMKFEQLRVKSGINFADPASIKNASDKDLKQMQFLLKQKENMNKSLELINRLYDYQLSEMYPNWDGRKYLTLEEKELFVMAEEFYGKNLTPKDFINPPRKYSKEEQKEIITYLYSIQNNKIESNSDDPNYQFLQNKYPDFQLQNQSYKQMFYNECMRYRDEIGQDTIDQLQRIFNVLPYKNVEELQSDSLSNSIPNSKLISSNGFDFFSILESAIREADRKWREDEFEQRNKKKKRQKGMDR
ncbi:hypothetical protein [Bacillus salipaludis]|uniref:hypothetical protein n=1 Tax=Bacillus salipaludis TaxID=2547811 RepID=UPI0022A7E640|nr:hypothetical protein [Bacillus salipaludis]